MKRAMLFTVFCLSCFILNAQPSGGPYGPVNQKYVLPDIDGKIYYVAPDGRPEQSGVTIELPTSIENAMKKVVSGDAIVFRGGVYRTGNLILNQSIIMQPYESEQVVLKGTMVADEWQDLGHGIWVTSWDKLFPMKPETWWKIEREGMKTPLHRFNNDMVFVDGEFLQSAGWEGEVDENSFYIDYENKKIYIGIDPSDKLVEITAYDLALHRITDNVNGLKSDGKGPFIKGLTFTQYAYRAIEIEGTDPEGISNEKDHGKEVVGTRLEHCEISWCSRVAAYLRGDNLTVSHCKIANTSTEGLFILSSSDVLLEKNVFARNNIERITGYYPAAVKIFNQCYRVTCNDNLVIDHPYSNGIWYDVGNVDGVFTNNWLEDIGIVNSEFKSDSPWPSDNAFFFEISKGAICAGNVFVDCDHGIFILNSSDVKVYNNTFVNSTAVIGRTERVAEGDLFGWHASTGPGIDERDGHEFVNNLLTGNANYKRPLLFIWQRDFLCDQLPDPMMKALDHNVYMRTSHLDDIPLILWSPAKNEKCQIGFNSLDEISKAYSNFSVNSLYFNNNEPLFKSRELGNFTLLPEFPGLKAATKLPADIMILIGNDSNSEKYIGAYALPN